MLHKLLGPLWNAMQGTIQWYILWALHAKYIVGVSGVVLDDEGRVLLLRHRYRAPDRAWGLPSGYASSGEHFEETLGREVWEETGCRVEVTELLQIVSGYKLRLEIFFLAHHVEHEPQPDQREVLEARFFHPDEFPAGLPEWHVKIVELALGRVETEGRDARVEADT